MKTEGDDTISVSYAQCDYVSSAELDSSLLGYVSEVALCRVKLWRLQTGDGGLASSVSPLGSTKQLRIRGRRDWETR